MLQKVFLILFLVFPLSSCKTAPKVTVCISDVPAGGFQCYDQRIQTSFFLAYKDSDKFVAVPPEDEKTLLTYCSQPGN